MTLLDDVQGALTEATLALEEDDRAVSRLLRAWTRFEHVAPEVHAVLARISSPVVRAVAAERLGAFALAHVALGHRLADRLDPDPYRAHAWDAFRAWRCHADPSSDPIEARAVASPSDCASIEFALLPAERVRVALHHHRDSWCGTYGGLAVAACALEQERIHDQLREHYAARGAAEALLMQRSQLFGGYAVSWSRCLLDSPIEWDDGACATLSERINRLKVKSIHVAPHGPLWTVPWMLLRGAVDTEWFGERFAIRVYPSTRRSARAAEPGTVLDRISVDPHGCERPEALFERAARFKVPRVVLHGRFDSDAPFDSRVFSSHRSPDWSLGELVDAAVRSPGIPPTVVLHVCESSESSRAAVVADNFLIASAFLAAGAREVVCWWARVAAANQPSVEVLVDDVHERIIYGVEPADAVRDVATPMLARWRDAIGKGTTDGLTRSCAADSAEIATLHDMAHLTVLARRTTRQVAS